MTYQTDNPEIDKLYTENRRLQEENKQLKLYKELYIKLRKQFDEYNKHNKKQKADFIKRLKEGEIKTTEQIMRCELDILKGIESEGEREREFHYKRKSYNSKNN